MIEAMHCCFCLLAFISLLVYEAMCVHVSTCLVSAHLLLCDVLWAMILKHNEDDYFDMLSRRWYLTTFAGNELTTMWLMFVEEVVKPTLPSARRANFQPSSLTDAELCAWLPSFDSWKPANATEQQARFLRHNMIPETIYRYPDGVKVADQVFVPTSESISPLYDPQEMKSSIIMAIRPVGDTNTYYGVIRDVWYVLQPGSSGFHNNSKYDLVVSGSWFVQPTAENNRRNKTTLPMVRQTFYKGSDIKTGSLWSAHMISPTRICLAPHPASDLPRHLLVLSRDGRVEEHAHPDWGPNPVLASGEEATRFRRLRRDMPIPVEDEDELPDDAAAVRWSSRGNQ